MTWFVRSRLIGSLDIGNGQTLSSHLLARTRVVYSAEPALFLEKFALPAEAPAEGSPQTEWFETLRSALILRPAGNEEAARIRDIYKLRLRPADPPPYFPFAMEQSAAGGPCGSRAELPSQLVLSRALAVLHLLDGTVLVTHPAGAPVHLARELWEKALEFRSCREPHGDERHLCSFLREKKLLWASEDEEREQSRRSVRTDGAVLAASYPVGNRWRQRYRPYTMEMVTGKAVPARIGLVGACQVQLVAEALEFLGLQQGFALQTVSALEPGDELVAEGELSAVVCSVAPFSALFLEAAAAEDREGVERLLPHVVSRADDMVTQIRRITNAPILVFGLGQPGYAPFAPSSRFHHFFCGKLAEINRRLLRCFEDKEQVELLDIDAAVSHFGGDYWDDAFNALPHHSAISSWSWVTLKPGVTDGPPEPDEIPPHGETQQDPAEPMAAQILHALRRNSLPRVRLIVFEPNDLLWRGSLSDRTEPYVTPPHFFADVEEYIYAGLHEALSGLRRKGVQLACMSDTTPAALRELWKVRSPLRNIVRPEDICALLDGEDADAALRQLEAQTGVPSREMLWLNLRRKTPPDGFEGRYWNGDRWMLRRLLLGDPALESESAGEAALPAEAQVRTAAPAIDRTTDVPAMLKSIVVKRLRCTERSYDTQTDLRYLGLNSLGGLELMNELEQQFGIAFEDADFTEPVVFNQAALSEAVKRAMARAALPGTERALRDGDWSSSTLGEILLGRLRQPQQPWAIKFVRSAESFDCEFISARELLRKASAWIHVWELAGIAPAAPVALALPLGSWLVAGVVGALISGRLPLVIPEPTSATADLNAWRLAMAAVSGSAVPLCCEGWVAKSLSLKPPEAFCPPETTGSYPMHAATADPDGTALLLRSSGTAGSIKIACHTHRGLLSRVQELQKAQKLSEQDRLVSWVPLHHTIGLINGLLLPLVLDIPATLLPPALFAQRPDVFVRELSVSRGTFAYMPNFAFAHCGRHIADARLAGVDLSPMRSLVCAGELVTAAALDVLFERLAPFGLRRSALSSGYGMAEAAGAITQSPPGREPLRVKASLDAYQRHSRIEETADDADAVTFVSSGPVLPQVQARIRKQDGSIAPEDCVGGIEVCSPSQVSALLNPDRDESPRLPLTADGFLRTGDDGFLHLGELFVTGRISDMIIAAGKNVNPAQVEETLSALPGLAASNVLVFASRHADTQQIEVLVELSAGLGREEADLLKQSIRGKVLDFYQVPVHAVHLCAEPVLVRTASGKVARAESQANFSKRRPTDE